MLRKRRIKSNKIGSLIGKDIMIEGLIITEGSLRIEGTLRGEIEAKGDVFVGETGKIQGNLVVNNLLVAGEVIGNIRAFGRLEITQTGRLEGDLETQTLVIAEGAQYRGRCLMGSPGQEAAAQETDTIGEVEQK
ncbi:MAG: bactofilin family protein [Bacillota bacterium]